MNIMKQTCMLLYFCFCCIPLVAQPEIQTYTKMYDFDFTMKVDSLTKYPWLQNRAYVNYVLPVISKDSGRALFINRYVKGFPFSDRLRTEYLQRVLLPIHHERVGSIRFECKGKNIKSVSILLDGINGEEKILSSDTLTFVPDSFLCITEKKIGLPDAELLNIKIRAEGDPGKEAFIAFGKLEIFIGDKSIDAFPIRKIQALQPQEHEKYIPIDLSDRNTAEKIESVTDKRIIGFGESIHGNSSIMNLVLEMILQAVERQGCKLVIIEFPIEKSFLVNRYIQGRDSDIDVDSALFFDSTMGKFLNKLRSYNSNRTDADKVKVFGMDYQFLSYADLNSAVDIFDFIVRINSDLKIPEIDKFAVLLMEQEPAKAADYLKTHNKEMLKLLTPDEIECIAHILSVSSKIGNDDIKRKIARDSVMFVNSKFLIEKFSAEPRSKVIIYGHGGHINPVSTFPAIPCKPFGSYMQEEYQGDYQPFLFLIGNGQTLASDNAHNRKQFLLDNPPEESAEFFFSSFKDDIFYYPLTADFNKPILSRCIGMQYVAPEFVPFNLFQRYCGIFFIKKPYLTQSAPELSFEETWNKFLKKRQQRQKIWSELRKRISN